MDVHRVVSGRVDGVRAYPRHETEFIRLVFPFDIKNPPPEATFTPKREPITIEDLKVGDQVFVRASHPIRTGEDILDPLEVQVLP